LAYNSIKKFKNHNQIFNFLIQTSSDIFKGLSCFREGVREIPIENIPGILEAGWIPPTERPGSGSRSNGRSQDDPDVLFNAFKMILNSTKNHQVNFLQYWLHFQRLILRPQFTYKLNTTSRIL